MPGESDFLGPRFVGQRFDNHILPIEVLKDLSALEELILELAKWIYIQEHPNRQRTPKRFSEGISLGIQNIEQGSAVPKLILVVAASLTLNLPESQPYFNKAKDHLISALKQAELQQPITDIPSHLLNYFDKLGRSLKDGESIEFQPESLDHKAVLNKETRRRLVLASPQIQEIREEVQIKGLIYAIDKSQLAYSLELLDGQKINGKYELQHEITLSEALQGYRENTKVLILGTAVYSRNNPDKIKSLESLDRISILDPLDVSLQLLSIKELNDGWLDGLGKAPKGQDLQWFEQTFDQQYPEDLPNPYLYPTESGGLFAEWTFGANEASLEINLETKAAYFHNLYLADNSDLEEVLNLEQSSGWHRLQQLIRGLFS